ncbi:hypothetical protein, partial [Zooshikella ganghwensis]|uniref:hypothetical protein n=1 Tax=Zooshikella ganghwensis TaxID=202772 RepID=UPI001B7F9E17
MVLRRLDYSQGSFSSPCKERSTPRLQTSCVVIYRFCLSIATTRRRFVIINPTPHVKKFVQDISGVLAASQQSA